VLGSAICRAEGGGPEGGDEEKEGKAGLVQKSRQKLRGTAAAAAALIVKAAMGWGLS